MNVERSSKSSIIATELHFNDGRPADVAVAGTDGTTAKSEEAVSSF